MSTVRELHNRAMELASLALIARHQGQPDEAESLAQQAYQYESDAADLVPYGESSEPTRSILYRSAASLAYQCREYAVALRLIAKGLSGFPPPEVGDELQGLFEKVRFEQYLRERQVVRETGTGW